MTKTALQLIQQGWTQQAYARDKRGVSVCYYSDDAVCWCARGAIDAAYGNGPETYRAFERLEEVVGTDIASWNDKPGRTKEDIIDAFMNAGI